MRFLRPLFFFSVALLLSVSTVFAEGSCYDLGIDYRLQRLGADQLSVRITFPTADNGKTYYVRMYDDTSSLASKLNETSKMVVADNQIGFTYGAEAIAAFNTAISRRGIYPYIYIPKDWGFDTNHCILDGFQGYFLTAMSQSLGCFDTAGCGFCPNPLDYCKIENGLANCVRVPGQCNAPAEPPTIVPIACGGSFNVNESLVDPSRIRQCECTGPDGEPSPNQFIREGVICCGWPNGSNCSATEPAPIGPVGCGVAFSGPRNCACLNADGGVAQEAMPDGRTCCGVLNAAGQCGNPGDPRCERVGQCVDNKICTFQNGVLTPGGAPCTNESDPPPDGGGGDDDDDGGDGGGGGGGTVDTGLNIFQGPTADTFRQLNPFFLVGGEEAANRFNSPAGIVNRALTFLFPLAGLALFFMLVWGGFEILSKATDAKAVQAGRQRITAAIIGFIVLFASFWIIQVVEWVFGLSIL